MAGGTDAYPNEDEGGRMITEINVTPLVDIVLVLLIVFMVTTTYMVNPSLKVDLPKAASGSETQKSSLALSLDKDGKLFLNGESADETKVKAFIAAELPKNADLQAVIAADKSVPHGDVVHVIDVVKRAGVKKFAINVEAAGNSGLAP
ncbi:MAG: biopolymer transporter ExbD [Deltaproteobacteria bacterium]|nr:biopolymer transporter ExbD [Deltaproteobacteria bacterium]